MFKNNEVKQLVKSWYSLFSLFLSTTILWSLISCFQKSTKTALYSVGNPRSQYTQYRTPHVYVEMIYIEVEKKTTLAMIF